MSLFWGANAFLLDRIHKYVQIDVFGWRGGEYVPVTGFFDYVLVWNTGISYGLLGNAAGCWAIGIVIGCRHAAADLLVVRRPRTGWSRSG